MKMEANKFKLLFNIEHRLALKILIAIMAACVSSHESLIDRPLNFYYIPINKNRCSWELN